ncbi:SAV_2336 N-terminal domain-related protein [Streptomyces sp. NPDC001515]
MIEELLAALLESGADAGHEELADILWLAARISAEGHLARTGDGGEPDVEHGAVPPSKPDRDDGGPQASERYYSATPAEDTSGVSSDARRGEAVLVRRALALENPLGIMRALRPLGRRTAPGVTTTELDEELSANSSAEQGMVVPILKPQRGRWLDLALVIDTHHSMLLWHDLVSELTRTIEQTGIFRDVRVWFLSGTEAGGTPTVARANGGDSRRPQEVADPSGHRLVLVVTDTVAEGWSATSLEAVLAQWATHSPLALLNVLPRRLWTRGAVAPAGVVVRAARPAAPNASWRLAEAAPLGGRSRPSSRSRGRQGLAGSIAIPIVEASPPGLAVLASLVAGEGRWNRLSCLTIGRTGTDSGPAPAPAFVAAPELDGTQALRRFQEAASPVAQELAGYLSAVPLTLPVMTLVRRAMLPHSDHGHIAEVALGGLLEGWQDGHGMRDMARFEFHFLPGVREALLGAQLRHDITAVQELVRREVAGYVERLAGGVGGDFPAMRTTAGGTGERSIGPRAMPFAESALPRAAWQQERERFSFPVPGGVVAMASVPAINGRTYLATYSRPDGKVRTWDPETGSMVSEPFTVQAPGVVAIAAVPRRARSPLLATVDYGGEVRLWESTDGRYVGIRYAIRSKEVLSMAEFLEANEPPRLVVAEYGGGFQTRDAMNGAPVGKTLRTGAFPGRAVTALVDPAGRRCLATADYSGIVRLWNLRVEPAARHELITIRPQKVLAMAAIDRSWSHSLLATIGYDSIVRVWDPFVGSKVPDPDSVLDLDAMDPIRFERLVFRLLEEMGEGSVAIDERRDTGIDAMLTRPGARETIIVQVKHVRRAVAGEVIRSFAQSIHDSEARKGMVITNGTFSKSSIEFAQGVGRIQLIDGRALRGLMREHLGIDFFLESPPNVPPATRDSR